MSRITFLLKYIQYFLTAKHRKGYGIHSPFLFDLIRNVLISNQENSALGDIEKLRYDLMHENRKIKITDLGAGSQLSKSKYRTVKSLAKNSAIKKKFGLMLHRMVSKYKPKILLELGTSLGIGTLYISNKDAKSKVYTIEGCPETAKIALKNFKKFKKRNIHQIIGSFEEKLPELLKEIIKLDFVVFDGNHQKEATLKYFKLCKEKAHNDTIFYFDDIHWSRGMEEAWHEIKSDKDVILTVDLFFSGIIFFKKELSKQNFIIKF